MLTRNRIRLALMALTLITIWAGARAYSKIFKPEFNELNRRIQ